MVQLCAILIAYFHDSYNYAATTFQYHSMVVILKQSDNVVKAVYSEKWIHWTKCLPQPIMKQKSRPKPIKMSSSVSFGQFNTLNSNQLITIREGQCSKSYFLFVGKLANRVVPVHYIVFTASLSEKSNWEFWALLSTFERSILKQLIVDENSFNPMIELLYCKVQSKETKANCC